MSLVPWQIDKVVFELPVVVCFAAAAASGAVGFWLSLRTVSVVPPWQTRPESAAAVLVFAHLLVLFVLW